MSRGQATRLSPDHRRRGPLLARLAQLMPPVSLPDRWAFFAASEKARQIPADLPALVRALANDFSAADLQAAKVLVLDAEQQWVISPVLGDGVGCALVVQQPNRPYPYDIVTVHGSLVAGDQPALHADRDGETRRFCELAGERMILAASRASDLALLAELRLPCTSAAGLADLDSRQFYRLCSIENSSHRPELQQLSLFRDGFDLVLVGWHLTELELQQPAAIKPILARLAQAADAFDVLTMDLSRIRLWSPAESELRAVRAAMGLRDGMVARRALWESVCRAQPALAILRQTPPARDYAEARERLMALAGQETTCCRDRIRQGLDDLRRTYAEEVTLPITRTAAATTSGHERALLIASADLLTAAHERSDIVRRAAAAATGFSLPAVDPAESLEEQARVIRTLLQVQQALDREP